MYGRCTEAERRGLYEASMTSCRSNALRTVVPNKPDISARARRADAS